MIENKNFNWLTSDIYSSLVVKVMYNDNTLLGIFDVKGVLDITGEELKIVTANIEDLTNFLTMGIVRFVNGNDILDIPFRNLYKLYENADILGVSKEGKMISFKEIEAFAVINGEVINDLFLSCTLINEVMDDLKTVMKIANDFSSYGMNEKFDALTKVTVVNHRRLMNDNI